MDFSPDQVLVLLGAQQRSFGQVIVERVDGDLVLGRFTPGPDFPAVQALFQEFESLVNQQIIPLADEVGAAIDALEFRLASPDGCRLWKVEDVQLFNGTDLSCRLRDRGDEQDSAFKEGAVGIADLAMSRPPAPA